MFSIRITSAVTTFFQQDTSRMFTEHLIITDTLVELTVLWYCLRTPGRITNTTARRWDSTAVAREEGQWLMLKLFELVIFITLASNAWWRWDRLPSTLLSISCPSRPSRIKLLQSIVLPTGAIRSAGYRIQAVAAGGTLDWHGKSRAETC